MKDVHGIWLPDGEEHLQQFATGPGWNYQIDKFNAAKPWIRGWNLAIDIGAHCGLWSRFLLKSFKEVVAFEPLEMHRECYVKNVQGTFTLHPYALGKTNGSVNIYSPPGQSGSSYVKGAGPLEMRTLDEFKLTPDFIKIDTEGYELNVLKGAVETLKHRPTLIVEQKPKNASRYGFDDTEAITWLKKLGYEQCLVISGDYIMAPKNLL